MVATGLPLDKTVITSPAVTSRRTLEKCRLASRAEMVFIKTSFVVLITTLSANSVGSQFRNEVLNRSYPLLAWSLLPRRGDLQILSTATLLAKQRV
jgi:hypothetical protein